MNEPLSKAPLANRLLYWLAKFLMRISGWRIEGEEPDIPKYVIISTHTSNWDYEIGILMAAIVSIGFSHLKLMWLGKHTLFRGPLGRFLYWTGGIPVDRSRGYTALKRAIRAIRDNERIVIGIAPEGTRKKAAHWKPGFYYIATIANVPIVCLFADYKRKAIGFGPIIIPSGDVQADMELIRDYYGQVSAKYPEQVGDIRVLSKT